MSYPDAFFRFCQATKIISSLGEDLSRVTLQKELVDAVKRIDSNAEVYKYLSNTVGDSILDKSWRYVWFNYYFWEGLRPIYSSSSPYKVNATSTKIRMYDSAMQNLLNRKDAIKAKLVAQLNATPATITVEEAWEQYAKKVRDESHSYREVIDSGLFHIGFLSPEGGLTDLGYKYVEACERVGTPYSGIPLEILRAAVLQNGQYGAMLHYFYKFSEEKFSNDLFAFTTKDSHGNYKFIPQDYLIWLDDIFANSLHILKKSTVRAGGTRKPFQAELTFLKKMGFVKSKGSKTAYRVGVGLEIDWPQVQSSMLYFQGL